MSEEEEYKVERIKGWRYNKREGLRKEYLIKWENYPEEENTYEPEEHLSCPEELERFINSLSGSDYRYFHIDDPSRLNGFQRRAEFVRCVGADIPPTQNTNGYNNGNQNGNSNYKSGTKQPFILRALFMDSDEPEEVTLEQFFKYRSDEAFRFFECRLAYKTHD